jgi:3-(3-hydroxy-phenyl)propionate hydroxylase
VAPEALLDSYHVERRHAAAENILNSSRTADFLTPRSPAHALFRDAVLDLAERHAFARPMVNSGRLSAPAVYDGSPLNGPDDPDLPARTRPGAPLSDAPVDGGWLLDRFGDRFAVLALNCDVAGAGVDVVALRAPPDSELADRYLGDAPRAAYLVRPDQHVAARWRAADGAGVAAALDRAIGRPT